MSYLFVKFIYIILFLTIICKYKYKNNLRFIKDVLFINGYNKKRKNGFFYKFRILSQIEELNASFIESSEYLYSQFEPSIVRDYRVIIFSGCPWTRKVEEAIILAKKLNKKILFDIDDFLFNKKFENKFSFANNLYQKEKELFNDAILEIRKIIRLSDGVITTNEYLSNELSNFVSTVFINKNTFNEEVWKLSQDALRKKNNIKLNNYFTLGYFCDYDKCSSDLIVIKNILIKVLKEFKNLLLILVGQFSLPNYLKELSSQIIFKKAYDWKKLPEIFSNFDLNISPLEDNIFNKIKNEYAWTLASLVKVPTIASNYGVFKQIIKHNKTGLLCSKENDWYLSLKALINNEQYRKNLGENAYKYCEIEYNTIYNSNRLGNFINEKN